MKLTIVIPVYNEHEVLPQTAPIFLQELENLIKEELVSEDSNILFVDDGSKDDSWQIITELASQNAHFKGIRQSRNRGHQNALLAGLMEVKDSCDITISMDCDGQDDPAVMKDMVVAHLAGSEIVYGVRSSRTSDKALKRSTALHYYRFMQKMGTEVVYNHADYRLVSARVLREFTDFQEVNLFLRGMFPLVGFNSSCVYYERKERLAGRSKYPLHSMISLAVNGITSLSVKPIRFVTLAGMLVSALSFLGIIWAIISYILGLTVAGWASMICIVCFMGGIQLLSLGIIGEYVGKTYMEVKHRPRYIISERTKEAEDSVSK